MRPLRTGYRRAGREIVSVDNAEIAALRLPPGGSSPNARGSLAWRRRVKAVTAPALVGLGDWVDRRAKPVTRWLDARVLPVGGRSADPALAWLVGLAVRAGWVTLPLAGCSACSRRRQWLNRLLPDLRSPRAWLGLPARLWRSLMSTTFAAAILQARRSGPEKPRK